MGKLHVVILKCENGHPFGGTVYIDGQMTLTDAIGSLRSYISGALKPGFAPECPLCHNQEFHFHDEETPFDHPTDAGCREYLDAMKQTQMAGIDNPDIVAVSALRTKVTIYDMKGKKVEMQVQTPQKIMTKADAENKGGA